jgi:hypothetical protein
LILIFRLRLGLPSGTFLQVMRLIFCTYVHFPQFVWHILRSIEPNNPRDLSFNPPNRSVRKLYLSIYRAHILACFTFRSIERIYSHALLFDLSSAYTRMLYISIYRAQTLACFIFRSIERKYSHALPFDLSSPNTSMLYLSIYRAQIITCCAFQFREPRHCERCPCWPHVAGRKGFLRSDCSNCRITESRVVTDDKQGGDFFKWTGGQQKLMCASSHPAAKCCNGQMPSSESQSNGVGQYRIYFS